MNPVLPRAISYYARRSDDGLAWQFLKAHLARVANKAGGFLNGVVTLRVTGGVRAAYSDDIKRNPAEWRPIPHAEREDYIGRVTRD